MLKRLLTLSILAALLSPGDLNAIDSQRDVLTQISTIDALISGLYDGKTPIVELKRYGDVGVGTFQGLDGEMVVLDGVIYQVRGDGSVRIPDLTTTTPFAMVTFLDADQERVLRPGSTLSEVFQQIDAILPSKNIFQAIRIEGVFEKVTTRSVPKQSKPYPPLDKVLRAQPIFDLVNVEGVMVGFRCPPFVKGINVPGYQLQFLTKDRQAGGRVLDLTVKKATAKIDNTPEFHLILPDDLDFYRLNLEAENSLPQK